MAETAIEAPEKGKHGGKRTGAGGPRSRPDATVAELQAGGLLKLNEEQLAMDFFEMIRTFEENEWREHLQMYLHRLSPITDRTKSGSFKYLQKYVAVTDPDEIMKEFGSGGYRLTLNRFNPVNRTSTRLREHVFDIENRNYPPIVPYGEWIDDERNKKWLWAKPALLAHQANAYAANGVGNMNTDPVAMFKSAVDAVGKLKPEANEAERTNLAKMVIDEIRANRDYERKSNDPGQMMAIVKTIIEAVKPQPAAGSDGMMAMMLQQMKASDERFQLLLAKLLDGGAKKSFVDELKELKEAVGLFGGGSDRGPRDRGTTGWDVARDLGSEALKVLGLVGQVYVARMGLGGPPRPPGAPGTHSTQIEVVNPEPVEMSPEDKVRIVKAIADQYAGLFDEITPHLVDQFDKYDGLEFREWFKEEYGKAVYRGMRSFSKETFLEVIELRKKEAPAPIAAKLAQLAPPEKLAKFIDEFLSDTPIEPDDDDEEDRLPVNPTTGEF